MIEWVHVLRRERYSSILVDTNVLTYLCGGECRRLVNAENPSPSIRTRWMRLRHSIAPNLVGRFYYTQKERSTRHNALYFIVRVSDISVVYLGVRRAHE